MPESRKRGAFPGRSPAHHLHLHFLPSYTSQGYLPKGTFLEWRSSSPESQAHHQMLLNPLSPACNAPQGPLSQSEKTIATDPRARKTPDGWRFHSHHFPLSPWSCLPSLHAQLLLYSLSGVSSGGWGPLLGGQGRQREGQGAR